MPSRELYLKNSQKFVQLEQASFNLAWYSPPIPWDEVSSGGASQWTASNDDDRGLVERTSHSVNVCSKLNNDAIYWDFYRAQPEKLLVAIIDSQPTLKSMFHVSGVMCASQKVNGVQLSCFRHDVPARLAYPFPCVKGTHISLWIVIADMQRILTGKLNYIKTWLPLRKPPGPSAPLWQPYLHWTENVRVVLYSIDLYSVLRVKFRFCSTKAAGV